MSRRVEAGSADSPDVVTAIAYTWTRADLLVPPGHYVPAGLRLMWDAVRVRDRCSLVTDNRKEVCHRDVPGGDT